MATIKLLIGGSALALALTTSSCCNMGSTCSSSGGKGDCDVWPDVQEHAEYGDACASD